MGFRQGPTQTGLYSHKRWSEACYLGFRKRRDRTIYVAKLKALISRAIAAQLICAFVFAYANSRFSHDAAQIIGRMSLGYGISVKVKGDFITYRLKMGSDEVINIKK